MSNFRFRLYIAGNTPRSASAIENLRAICEEYLPDDFHLTICDVLEQPHLAEEDKVIATPTVLKVSPPPVRRIIGDLRDKGKVLMGLDLIKKTEKEWTE